MVIGILIAIQLNDFNENRKESKRELSFLQKMKDDINLDIRELSLTNSTLTQYNSNNEYGVELMLKAKTVKDIIALDSLIDYGWNNIRVNRKTYDEMLSTTGIYILKNRDLLNNLSDHYALVEKYQQYLREINEDSREYNKSPEMNPFNFLRNNYPNSSFDLSRLDTSWIGNYTSPTYMALSRFYTHVMNAVNGNKQRYISEILENSHALVAEIDQELRKRDGRNK